MTEVDELKTLLKELSKKDINLLVESWQECIDQGYLRSFPIISYKSFQKDVLTIDDYAEYILDTTEDIENRYAKYWRMMFEYSANKNFDIENKREKLYKSLLDETIAKFDLTYLKENENSDKRVFIFVNQYLLNSQHSPSISVERLVDGLKEQVNDIVIISSTPYPYPYPENNFQTFKYSGIEENKLFRLNEKTILVELRGYPSESKFFDFIRQNKLSSNDKYILVGHSNLHFDMIPFKNKILLGTTIDTFSLSTAKYILTTLKKDIYNIDSNKMVLIETSNDYTRSNTTKFKPKIILSNDTINVAIIGNRLNSEIDRSFILELIKLKKNISKVKILIIGDFNKIDLIPQEYRKDFEIVGFIENLFEYISQNVHFYLNPDRIGGGQSAVLALKSGIPVITLPRGDVFFAIREKYSINSFSEISKFITSYINDRDFKDTIDNKNEMLVENHEKKFLDSMEKILSI